MVLEKRIGNNHVYANFRVGENFCATPDKHIFSRFVSPFSKRSARGSEWRFVQEDLSDAMKRVSVRYIAKFEESGEIERLGKTIAVIVGKEELRGAVQKKINCLDVLETIILRTQMLITTLLNKDHYLAYYVGEYFVFLFAI